LWQSVVDAVKSADAQYQTANMHTDTAKNLASARLLPIAVRLPGFCTGKDFQVYCLSRTFPHTAKCPT